MMRKTCWNAVYERSTHNSGCLWLSVSRRHSLSVFVWLHTWSFLRGLTWDDLQDPVSHKLKAEDRAKAEAEDAPSAHPDSSNSQDRSHNNRCSREDEVEVVGNREEVDKVHNAHSVGAGATFGNSAQ